MQQKEAKADFLAVPAGVSWCVVDRRSGEQVLAGYLSQLEAIELARMLTHMGRDNLRPDAALIVQGGHPVLWTGPKTSFRAS
jgi:hypothetical protein